MKTSEKKIDKSCPIPNTHGRLAEAHHIWHQTGAQYQDPIGFKTNLNALIQGLRNITFVLQKEKHSIPNFESWYQEWQVKMREDPVLKWLLKSRNLIVKEGDLNTKSMVRIKIFNWKNVALAEWEVPPLLPTHLIAATVAEKGVPGAPSSVIENCVLSVERRWVASNLSDWELLDALSHCYGVLSTIVAEAHQNLGFIFGVCQRNYFLEEKEIPSDHLGGRLPCMIANSELRTVYLSLKDKQYLNFESKKFLMTEKLGKKAKKRYRFEQKITQPTKNHEDPFKMAEWCMEVGKTILARDKYHGGTIFLRLPGGKWEIHSVNPEEEADKYILFRGLANRVERTGADAIIHIGEFWYVPLKKAMEQGITASKSPDRQEALAVTVATSNGETRHYLTEFSRSLFGKIQFKPTQVLKSERLQFLNPILEVWKKQERGSGLRS